MVVSLCILCEQREGEGPTSPGALLVLDVVVARLRSDRSRAPTPPFSLFTPRTCTENLAMFSWLRPPPLTIEGLRPCVEKQT